MAARKWPESQYRRNERPRERLMKVPETSPGHLSDGEVRSRFSKRSKGERKREGEQRGKKRKKERGRREWRRERVRWRPSRKGGIEERRMIPVSETLFEATNE